MYSVELDQKCKCLNFTLHEDLGILRHVFADKTGTLTANKLTFKGASVANIKFVDKHDDDLVFDRIMRYIDGRSSSINSENKRSSFSEPL